MTRNCSLRQWREIAASRAFAGPSTTNHNQKTTAASCWGARRGTCKVDGYSHIAVCTVVYIIRTSCTIPASGADLGLSALHHLRLEGQTLGLSPLVPPHRQMQRLVARLIFLVISKRNATSRRPSVGPNVPSRVASRIFGCHVSSRPLPYQRI